MRTKAPRRCDRCTRKPVHLVTWSYPEGRPEQFLCEPCADVARRERRASIGMRTLAYWRPGVTP